MISKVRGDFCCRPLCYYISLALYIWLTYQMKLIVVYSVEHLNSCGYGPETTSISHCSLVKAVNQHTVTSLSALVACKSRHLYDPHKQIGSFKNVDLRNCSILNNKLYNCIISREWKNKQVLLKLRIKRAFLYKLTQFLGPSRYHLDVYLFVSCRSIGVLFQL